MPPHAPLCMQLYGAPCRRKRQFVAVQPARMPKTLQCERMPFKRRVSVLLYAVTAFLCCV